jgi:uncharacterized membrane protein YbhN (UPF0104 family)
MRDIDDTIVVMNRRYIRALLSLLVLIGTIVAFSYYFGHHPEISRQLKKTSPFRLLSLLALYSLFSGSIALILHASLKLCNTSMSRGESALLTMYSSVINFFGPLQSGPAFRAAYLKKKHGVSLKNYAAATVLYYAAYGLISVAFLFSGVLGWTLVGLFIVAVVCIYILLKSSYGARFKKLRLRSIGYLLIATFLQIVIVTVIFFIELRGIDHTVTIGQAIIYSGAANLALFVSITPGAIGFRESFLYLSQRLHHLDNSTIVAANILDRSLYVTLLLIFAVYIFASHARTSLRSVADK